MTTDLLLPQLRQDVHLGIEQIERGEYTEYTADTLKDLAAEIKGKGRQLLADRSGR